MVYSVARIVLAVSVAGTAEGLARWSAQDDVGVGKIVQDRTNVRADHTVTRDVDAVHLDGLGVVVNGEKCAPALVHRCTS